MVAEHYSPAGEKYFELSRRGGGFNEEEDYKEARALMQLAMELNPDEQDRLNMLILCEVLYYGQTHMFEFGIDWYSVLHLHPSVTETEVRTHFKNLSNCLASLVEHSFPGVVKALELVMTAKLFLCNETSRAGFDLERGEFGLVDFPREFREVYLGWKPPVEVMRRVSEEPIVSNVSECEVRGQESMKEMLRMIEAHLFDESPQEGQKHSSNNVHEERDGVTMFISKNEIEEESNVALDNSNYRSPYKLKKPFCAAGRKSRRKCEKDCELAPYFPWTRISEFEAVHEVFGTKNVSDHLQSLKTSEERERAANSFIWEAYCRVRDPIEGCYGDYMRLKGSYDELFESLNLEMAQEKAIDDCYVENVFFLKMMQWMMSTSH